MTTPMPFVYFEGKILPKEDAKVSLSCNSLQYGTTCFAGIRGYVKKGTIEIFRLRDHWIRLMNGSKIMGFNYEIPYSAFQELIQNLITANKPETDFYIRAFILSTSENLAPKPKGLTFDLAIYFIPLGNYFDLNKGMRLMVSSWRKFPDSSFPTKAKAGGCYVNSFLATAEANQSGYEEALVMDQEGYIVEASVANLLMRYRDRLIMPELGSSLLEGITMRTIAELLALEGLEIHFERIDRSMVYTCDELILLGTAAQVAFAASVDGRKIGTEEPGPICKLAREKLGEVLRGVHPCSEKWIHSFQAARGKT
jgi:branched-chain amino acid aminotransferase